MKAWVWFSLCFALGQAVASEAGPQLQIEERIEYYDVAAPDRTTLIDRLHVPDSDPARSVHGLTRAVFVIDRKFTQTTQRCLIDALSIRLELRITLPRWAPGAALPRSLAQDWTSIRDQITLHEDRHKQNAMDAAFAMRDGFATAMGRQSCIEVERALHRVQVAALNKQQLMDRLLDQRPVLHGRARK